MMASYFDDGRRKVSASPSWNSIMLAKPFSLALSLAIASIPGDKSIAVTFQLGLTCLAAVTAGSPIPVAISRTLFPS